MVNISLKIYNVVLSEQYFWDNNKNVWKGRRKYTSKFDDDRNILSSENYGWDVNEMKWFLNSFDTYYYSSAVSSLEDDEVYTNLSIQFNTEGFTVNGLSVEGKLLLLDLSGRTLISKTISDNEYIYTANLSAGIYVLRIESGKDVLKTKFVK